MNSTFRGFSALLVAGLLYGSFGIYIRLLGVTVPAAEQFILTSIIILLLIVSITKYKKIPLSLTTIPRKYFLIYGLPFPLAGMLITIALFFTNIATVTATFLTTSFILSLVIGTSVFKEKISPQKIVSLLLALLGLIFITYPFSLAPNNLGVLLGIMAGGFDSLGNTASKFLSGKIENERLIFIRILGSLCVGVLFLLFAHQGIGFSAELSIYNIFLLIVYSGSVLLAATVVLIGFRNFDLNLGTIIVSSQLVFASFFAFLFFKETPTSFQIVGCVTILIAIVVANSTSLKVPQINR